MNPITLGTAQRNLEAAIKAAREAANVAVALKGAPLKPEQVDNLRDAERLARQAEQALNSAWWSLERTF